MGGLVDLDKALFLWINNGLASRWLDPLFYLWSQLGNAAVSFALVVALALIFKRPTFLKEHLPWLVAAALLGGVVVHWLKDFVGRDRPVEVFSQLVKAGKVHLHLVGPILSRSSFPSGHAQLAFAMATYLSFALPRWWWAFLGIAAGVALSRIYMGVHFPADCLAGAAIGALSALLAWKSRGWFLRGRSGKGPVRGCSP